jgi:thymidylate kinase
MTRHGRRGGAARTGGAFIGLVGPDGTGKTTLAAELERQCEAAGVPFGYIHWRPSPRDAFRSPAPNAVPLPKNPPRPDVSILDCAVSLVRLLRSAVTFNLAYFLSIRRRLRAGAVVVADRWIYNYIGQPYSVRYYGPSWIAVLVCCRLVVAPRPVVVLDLPTEQILRRSRELTATEVRSEYERLRRGLRLPEVRWLAADASPETLAREILVSNGALRAPAHESRHPRDSDVRGAQRPPPAADAQSGHERTTH